MRHLLLAFILTAVFPWAQEASGAVDAGPAIRMQRMNALIAILNGGGNVAESFSADFLARVPESQIHAIFSQLVQYLGKATGSHVLSSSGAAGAQVRVTFEQGTATLNLAFSPSPPGQITGLRIIETESLAVSRLHTLDAVAAAINALPGRTGFVAADLDARNGVAAAVALNTPLAIGSTFKLVVLAELARVINAGERHWDDPVKLDGRELPAGGFNHLPPGTAVPLHTLAEAMIKVSDNSAADILIHLLGRERIESMQAQAGIRHGALNVPFLTTMEAFKLKGSDGGKLGRRYPAMTPPARRRLLDGELAGTPGSSIGSLFADGRPVMIDHIEWFASPADLVRVMAWFYQQRRTPGGSEALRILAINPGPAVGMSKRFLYLGYKGGSEPGVISMTLLLGGKAGKWRVISASWNNPHQAVNEFRFEALVRQAIKLSALSKNGSSSA